MRAVGLMKSQEHVEALAGGEFALGVLLFDAARPSPLEGFGPEGFEALDFFFHKPLR